MNNKTISLFTDGGCRGNGKATNIGGWGAYMTYGPHKKEIKGGVANTTNNQMELIALIEGLKAVKMKNIEVNVYLDSSYVLDGITSWIQGWKAKGWKTASKKPVLNKELWMELDFEKSKFQKINFVKVEGHSGNIGNEKADTLCNEAMDELENKNMNSTIFA